MARILILAVVAILFFGGTIAADQMLQNPDLEPNTTADADEQQAFAEVSSEFLSIGAPVGMFALVVGSILAAVRVMGA